MNMDNAIRKTMLYKTGVEYGDYAINPFSGCSHGCRYPCYAYLMAQRFGKAKTVKDWQDFRICEDAVDIVKEELRKAHTRIKSVQLCFSTDPFMYGHPETDAVTIEIIKAVNDYGIPCHILTKGILPAELAGLSKINQYGITYVTNNENYRKDMEPNAAPLADRLAALRYLHDQGCKTWVSMEPYPTPNLIKQDLEEVLNAVSFVDRIVFGKINYNAIASQCPSEQFYGFCAGYVIGFCKSRGIDCHIKEGTISYES